MKTMLHMVAALLVVGLVAGGALSLVSGWAQPLIEANETRVKMAGIMEVVPGGATSKSLADVYPGGAASEAIEAYEVRDAAGAVKGWALVHEGTGFADKIRLMVGVAPDLRTTLGIKVLKDNETPGLGTKIREGAFPAQFFADGHAPLALDGQGLRVVKGTPADAHDVQAITGATISSKAVIRIVNDAVARLRRQLPAAAPAAGGAR